MWSLSINSHFLDLGSLTAREWSASRPSRCTAGIRGLCRLLFERDRVDSRAGLGDVYKRKLLTLPRLELDHSVVLPVASRVTDYAVPASCTEITKR
jgi:hypothetical protein